MRPNRDASHSVTFENPVDKPSLARSVEKTILLINCQAIQQVKAGRIIGSCLVGTTSAVVGSGQQSAGAGVGGIKVQDGVQPMDPFPFLVATQKNLGHAKTQLGILRMLLNFF